LFCENLIKLRTDAGKTRKEVAIDLKIDNSTYGYYEKGGKKPSYEMLIKLAQYFNVTVSDLIGDNDKSSTENKSDSKDILQQLGMNDETIAIFEYYNSLPEKDRAAFMDVFQAVTKLHKHHETMGDTSKDLAS